MFAIKLEINILVSQDILVSQKYITGKNETVLEDYFKLFQNLQ